VRLPVEAARALDAAAGRLGGQPIHLDAAPVGSAEAVDVGPLRAFVSSAPWPFYVRPRPDLDLTAPDAVSADDVRAAAAVLEQAEQAVTFEWVEQLVPSLRPALLEAGVTFVGGCCGTTPAFIRAVQEKLAQCAIS
jgi:hypothetical protein